MFDFTTPKRVSPKRVSFKNTENKIVNANCHLLCKKLVKPRKFDAFKPEVFTQDGLVLAFLSSFFFPFRVYLSYSLARENHKPCCNYFTARSN